MNKTKSASKKLDDKLFAAIIEASELVEKCTKVKCAAEIKESKRQSRDIVKLMEPLNKKQSDLIDAFGAGKITKARYDAGMKKLLKDAENIRANYKKTAPLVDLKACSLAHCNPDMRRLLARVYDMTDHECGSGTGNKKSCQIKDGAKKLMGRQTITAEEYLDFMWRHFRAISGP